MSRFIHLLGAGSVLALGLAMPTAFAQSDPQVNLPRCSEIGPPQPFRSTSIECRDDETGEPVSEFWLIEPPLPRVMVYGDRLDDDPGSVSTLSNEDITDTLADHPC